MLSFNEFKEQLNEAKTPNVVYHDTYSSAVQHAMRHAEDKGYDIDARDWQQHVGGGPGKPSDGKTTRHSIPLSKDGKPSKKTLNIQVYNRGTDNNSYELNHYIS